MAAPSSYGRYVLATKDAAFLYEHVDYHLKLHVMRV
jgi:hypothetical protein